MKATRPRTLNNNPSQIPKLTSSNHKYQAKKEEKQRGKNPTKTHKEITTKFAKPLTKNDKATRRTLKTYK